MKNAFRIVLAVLMFCAISLAMQGCAKKSAPANDPEVSRKAGPKEARKVVVATVNGAPINIDSLIRMMNRLAVKNLPNQTPEPAGELKQRALDRLIQQELAYQKAKADGLKPEEKYIDEAMANLRESFGGEKEYAEFLKQQNVTESELREQTDRSLTIELIIAREVNNKASVPEDELRKEYDREKQNYMVPEKVSVIDVAFIVKRDNDKNSSRKANTILRKLRADKDKDPWKLVLDGTFIIRTIDISSNKEKELYTAAKKLKVGGLSGVIKASDGLHIIKLRDYQPERTPPFDQAKTAIEGKFKPQARQKRLEEWERELRQDAKIEIKDVKIDIVDEPAIEAKEKKN